MLQFLLQSMLQLLPMLQLQLSVLQLGGQLTRFGISMQQLPWSATSVAKLTQLLIASVSAKRAVSLHADGASAARLSCIVLASFPTKL